MKKGMLKKTLAMVMATTMMFSMTAYAAESDDGATSAGSTIGGTGSVEDFIDKDVFKVVLPTVSDVDFTLDPQGLLKVADSAKYTIGPGAVYFENVPAGGGDSTYSKTSDAITIGNKSSYDVDVKATVSVTMPAGVSLVSTESALASATTPSVYLALVTDGGSPVALASGDNTVNPVKLDKVPEVDGSTVTAGYEIKAASDGSGGYTYSYAITGAPTLDEVDFQLQGACDAVADWTSVKDLNVTTSIVWSCAKHVDQAAPSIATRSYTAAAGSPIVINTDFGAGDAKATAITSVKYGSMEIGNNATYCTISGSTVTLTAASADYFLSTGDASATYTITFNDSAPTSVTVTVNAPVGD